MTSYDRDILVQSMTAHDIIKLFKRKPTLRKIVQDLIVEPTMRTGKEHGLLICRRKQQGLYRKPFFGVVTRGHRLSVSDFLCDPHGEVVMFLHTHPNECANSLELSVEDQLNVQQTRRPLCALSGKKRCNERGMICLTPKSVHTMIWKT